MTFLSFLSFCRPSNRSKALVDLIFVLSVEKYIENNMPPVEFVTKISKYIKTLFVQNMVKSVNLDFCSYFHVSRLSKFFDGFYDQIYCVFHRKTHRNSQVTGVIFIKKKMKSIEYCTEISRKYVKNDFLGIFVVFRAFKPL